MEMNLFKKKIEPIKFENVAVGQVYKFVNGCYTKEYYAVVIYKDEEKFITNIPNEHSLDISLNSNFNYHSKRMILVGNKDEYGYLVKSENIIKK